jgi:hypothetical protein
LEGVKHLAGNRKGKREDMGGIFSVDSHETNNMLEEETL